MSRTGKKVLIWRDVLLARSETFIANQAAAMTRYQPVFAGVTTQSGIDLLPSAPSLLVGEPRLSRLVQRKIFRRTGYSRSLTTLISQVDLVHAHFGPDAVSIMDTVAAANKPLIVTFHGFDVTVSPQYRQDWQMTRRWLELVRDRAHGMVAVSDFIANTIVDLGAPSSKVVRHHIGIPIPPDRLESARSGAILFVGRLVEKKGCDLLLRSVALLSDDLRGTPVRIVGDGPLREQLERLATSLGVNATFLGMQPPDVVDQELWSARVFVGPSRVAANGDTEGFGMVFLEAAARRLPAITARVGGAGEAVVDGETGFVVAPDSPGAIAERLTDVLREPTVGQRLGAAARARALEQFDILKQSAALEALYDQWLETWRPDPPGEAL